MATLQRERDGDQILLSTEHVIGRMRSCATCLSAEFVSLAHALFRWHGSLWELRDLGSTNGTYVDRTRVAAGESVQLRVGMLITFGGESETWRVVSDAPPNPAAVPLDGGEPSLLASGVLPIFRDETLVATIYQEREQWYLELDDAIMPLVSGQRFRVADREWRFECPSVSSATASSGAPVYGLDDLLLEFEHSSDEEHVTLSFGSGRTRQVLQERSCLYLALVLARRRLQDRRDDRSEHGWVKVEALLKMIPDYTSTSALNVEIFRLRRLFSDAGVRDFARIIERRRGELRLGTGNVVIRRLSDQPASQARSEAR